MVEAAEVDVKKVKRCVIKTVGDWHPTAEFGKHDLIPFGVVVSGQRIT